MSYWTERPDDEKKSDSINEIVFVALEVLFGLAVLAGCVVLTAAITQYFGH